MSILINNEDLKHCLTLWKQGESFNIVLSVLLWNCVIFVIWIIIHVFNTSDKFLSTDSDDRIDSPYNHIYGRLPIPTRGVIPPAPRAMYIGEWD